jgi:predicted nucleic acid-binding protein
MTRQATWSYLRTREPEVTREGRLWDGGYGVAETPAEYVISRPKLYVDTSVVSYLTARTSRDLTKARAQSITQEWWMLCRWQFDVCWSDEVCKEAGRGDQTAAQLRIDTLKQFTELPVDEAAKVLAEKIMKACRLPGKAQTDALHVAIAAKHDVQFLLTWNYRHLANDALLPKMMHICIREGYICPRILTPEQITRVQTHDPRANR